MFFLSHGLDASPDPELGYSQIEEDSVLQFHAIAATNAIDAKVERPNVCAMCPQTKRDGRPEGGTVGV
jgi:hypothetical protein